MHYIWKWCDGPLNQKYFFCVLILWWLSGGNQAKANTSYTANHTRVFRILQMIPKLHFWKINFYVRGNILGVEGDHTIREGSRVGKVSLTDKKLLEAEIITFLVLYQGNRKFRNIGLFGLFLRKFCILGIISWGKSWKKEKYRTHHVNIILYT